MINAVIGGFSDGVSPYLRIVLFHPVALALAVLMVLQQYAKPFIDANSFIGKYLGIAMARTFGVGVIILQLFYAPYLQTVVGNEPLSISLVILCGEAVLQVVIDLCTREVRPSLSDLKVENKYQDITIKFRRMAMLFWVQIALMGYFLIYVNNDETMHSGDLASILKWLVTLNLTQVTSDDEAGGNFRVAYWRGLLGQPIPEPVQKEKDRFCECIPVPFRFHWVLRCLCDFIVNGVCRVVIMGIAPIYLADTDNMDFIKDSLALFFVTRLDDYDDIISLRKRLKKWRSTKTSGANLNWLLEAIEAEAKDAERGSGGNNSDNDYHSDDCSDSDSDGYNNSCAWVWGRRLVPKEETTS